MSLRISKQRVTELGFSAIGTLGTTFLYGLLTKDLKNVSITLQAAWVKRGILMLTFTLANSF